MYVEYLGEMREGEEIGAFPEILEALDSLDGDRRPFLLIAEGAPVPESGYPYSGMAMVVEGGPDGYRCVVYSRDDENAYVMLSGRKDDGSYRTINRPYPDRVPANEIVDKQAVIKALGQFAENAAMTKEFEWLKS